MAKDPAFLFYPGDFSTGTQFFSDEQVGKYIRLLMAQHQLGHLEEKHMIMICKTYDKDVFSKFEQDSKGLYFNERLEYELIKRKKYSESRSKNRTNKNNICKSYDKHMENENKDINNNINNNREQFFKDLPNSTELETIAIDQKLTKEQVISYIPEFRKKAETTYPTYRRFVSHFKNWLNLQIKNNPVKKRNALL